MREIKGKFATAKVFTDDLETYAEAQIQMICDCEAAKGSSIRVMPDVHPGKVGPIGLTMTVGERIIPQLLGIDIGCGILCARIKEKRVEYQKLDKVIREKIPSGFAVRSHAHHEAEQFAFEALRCAKHIREEKAMLSLGTLGGGNHFIEIDKDEDGNHYILIHSGSRHLGKEITDYYMRAGAEKLQKAGMEVPYPMTWLEGELKEAYIHDLGIVQEYAALNRRVMLMELVKGMKFKVQEEFASVHNYLAMTDQGAVLRKGAISAKEGERVVIPVNMRDGVLLGTGKGNSDWNDSAPHGSGRKVRRDEMKNQYTVSAFKKDMKGIYSSCISAETLDEAPSAYRSLEEIRPYVGDTVEVDRVLKPVYNYKAGGKA